MAEESQGSNPSRPPLTPEDVERAQWPLSRAVITTTVTAVTTAAVLVTASLYGLGLTHHLTSSTGEILDLVKLAFALVAGVGGTIGLVLAYRRHKIAEAAVLIDRAKEAREARKEAQDLRKEEREAQRSLNERFGPAAAQLGSESYAVCVAGVYAMVALADDWDAGRQQCVNVLCAIVRRKTRTADLETDREIKTAVGRALAERLRTDERWQRCSFNFAEARFDFPVSFAGAVFTGGVTFDGALFRDAADFTDVRFTGSPASFRQAAFESGSAAFTRAVFDAEVPASFDGVAVRSGSLAFEAAEFRSGAVTFRGAQISGSCSFHRARFIGSTVTFDDARVLNGGRLAFSSAVVSGGEVRFSGLRVMAGELSFHGAGFTGGAVRFHDTGFRGGTTIFDNAEFTGGIVSFEGAKFTPEGKVDLSQPRHWTVPPVFDPGNPPGVRLPPPGTP